LGGLLHLEKTRGSAVVNRTTFREKKIALRAHLGSGESQERGRNISPLFLLKGSGRWSENKTWDGKGNQEDHGITKVRKDPPNHNPQPPPPTLKTNPTPQKKKNPPPPHPPQRARRRLVLWG